MGSGYRGSTLILALWLSLTQSSVFQGRRLILKLNRLMTFMGFQMLIWISLRQKGVNAGVGWERIFLGKEVTWAATKRGIMMNDITIEAKI